MSLFKMIFSIIVFLILVFLEIYCFSKIFPPFEEKKEKYSEKVKRFEKMRKKENYGSKK